MMSKVDDCVLMFVSITSVIAPYFVGGGELPVDDPAVDNLQDDNPLSAVLEEVGHLLLQLGLHLVLGDHLQVVPGCLAAALHLTQVLLQLVEIHLTGETQIRGSYRQAALPQL